MTGGGSDRRKRPRRDSSSGSSSDSDSGGDNVDAGVSSSEKDSHAKETAPAAASPDTRPLLEHADDQAMFGSLDTRETLPRNPGGLAIANLVPQSIKTQDWWEGRTLSHGIAKCASVQVIYHDINKYA